MRKFIYIFLFIVIILISKIKLSANSKIDLCVVYEKTSYEKGDIACLSFDLPKFSNLFEVIIRVEYDKKIFNPIIINNEYYKLNNHSIFDEFVVNKKINDNTIYAELMKNDVSDGYYSSYQNNLCMIDFNVLSYVDNIEEYFNSNNIQIFLFDVNHQLIDYEIKLVKMLDAGFYNNSYEINVFNDKLLVDNIFYVNNRKENEFIILEEKKVDLNKLGSQILQIGVFDIITGKYLSYSTIVNVIDNLAPYIITNDSYEILDTTLNELEFTDFIEVSDNYDKNVNIMVNYYNKEYKKIDSDYLSVLKKDFVIYVGFVAVDGSMNKSEEKIVEFNLIDSTCPIINVSDINIIDNDLFNFNIIDYINIYDELDSNPDVIITFYNSDLEVVDNYKEYWSSRKVRSHSNRCNLINSNNLATPDVMNVVLGFTNFINSASDVKKAKEGAKKFLSYIVATNNGFLFTLFIPFHNYITPLFILPFLPFDVPPHHFKLYIKMFCVD